MKQNIVGYNPKPLKVEEVAQLTRQQFLVVEAIQRVKKTSTITGLAKRFGVTNRSISQTIDRANERLKSLGSVGRVVILNGEHVGVVDVSKFKDELPFTEQERRYNSLANVVKHNIRPISEAYSKWKDGSLAPVKDSNGMQYLLVPIAAPNLCNLHKLATMVDVDFTPYDMSNLAEKIKAASTKG